MLKNVCLYYLTIFQSKFISFATLDLTGKFFINYLDLDYKEFIKHMLGVKIENRLKIVKQIQRNEPIDYL